MAQSEVLTRFYREWLSWAEAGGKGGEFYDDMGLCSNLRKFCAARELPISDTVQELRGQFKSHGVDDAYPFGEAAYDHQLEFGGMHADPKRLMWVRNRLEEAEAACG